MDFFGQLYLYASIALVLSLLFLVLRWPLGLHKTFSMHAAQTKALSAYYTVVFCITMPLMTITFFAYAPSNLSSYTAPALFLIATIMQIACTFFPEKGARRKIILHRTLAGISAGALFLCLGVLAVDITAPHQTYALTGIAIMGFCAFLALVLKERYALLLQSAFYLAFLIPTTLLFLS